MTQVHCKTYPKSHKLGWSNGISPFKVFVCIGCMVGLGLGGLAAPSFGMDSTRFIAAALCLLMLTMIGSRFWYVLQHAAYFRRHPHQIWNRRSGGASVDGGMAVALIGANPILWMFQLPFGNFLDGAMFWLLPIAVIGRFGCLLQGCCAGRATLGPLGLVLPDHHGVWRRRLPSQLFEALLGAVIFLAIPFLPVDWPGQLFAICLAIYSAGRIGLAFTREAYSSRRALAPAIALSSLLLLGSVAVISFG